MSMKKHNHTTPGKLVIRRQIISLGNAEDLPKKCICLFSTFVGLMPGHPLSRWLAMCRALPRHVLCLIDPLTVSAIM